MGQMDDLIRNNTSREEILNSDENFVYKKCVSEYKKKEPKIEEFSNIFSADEIARDGERVKRIKAQFKDETERSQIFEAVVADHLVTSKWLGENVAVSQTTEYDDIINHTDIVATFKDGKKTVRLGIDVTTSVDVDRLKQKTQYTENDIKIGFPPRLKYYKGTRHEPNARGRVKLHARVVLGTNVSGVKALSESVKDLLENKDNSKYIIETDPIQIEFLEATVEQLKHFIYYAKAVGLPDNHKIIKSHKKMLSIVKKIFDKKKRSIQISDTRARNKNEVYEYLTNLTS